MSQPVPRKLNDVKFFIIVLPVLTTLYLSVLWLFGRPLEINWFTLYPGGPVYANHDFLSYNRWLDIILGPFLAYIITLLWRHVYNDDQLDEPGFIYLIAGSIATAASAIAFLSGGALVAAAVGAVWMAGWTFLISALRLAYKVYRRCSPWWHC